MAHLLMIESWVGASGNLLPPLLRELGHSYTFVTRKASHYQNPMSSEKHAVFRYADDVIETETNDLQKLIKSVSHVRFDGVITVCDYYIETVCEVAKAYNVPCPFSGNVKTVCQKHLMRQALDRAGLSNPKYKIVYNLEDAKKAAQEIGYPLVLKPVDLASSAFVKLIQTSSELQQAYHDLENFPLNFRDQERERALLIEEYICGEELSVETVSNNGEITVVGITDKSVTGSPYFIENGHMFPAKLEEDAKEKISDYVRNVLLATGYDHGIAHTEIKLTKDGPKVVEINPRTAGNYIVELIEYVTGVNMLKAFVSLALGQQPAVTVTDTGVSSAAIMFIVPDRGGKIKQIRGADTLKENPSIIRYRIEDCEGESIQKPIDNACYLGHFITRDYEGFNARMFAESALGRLEVEFEETE